MEESNGFCDHPMNFCMKKTLLLFIPGLLITISSRGQETSEVEELFKTKCALCHRIGGGKLIGPDLANVQDRHSQEWLISFITSSQTMIKKGDPDAVALFEEHDRVEMPDPMISVEEILSLISYIGEQSAKGSGSIQPYVSIIEDATSEDVESGRNLFLGRKRFVNKGPSCNSCHNDISNTYFSENSYSIKDIRISFSNLGEEGVRAILENPPFPVMRKAFEGRNLQENEVHDLLAFLKEAGISSSAPSLPSSGYILYGLLGAALLLFLFAWLWYDRKSRSVNHQIFKRQIRAVN